MELVFGPGIYRHGEVNRRYRIESNAYVKAGAIATTVAMRIEGMMGAQQVEPSGLQAPLLLSVDSHYYMYRSTSAGVKLKDRRHTYIPRGKMVLWSLNLFFHIASDTP